MRILHVLPSLSQKSGGPLRAGLELSARGIELGLESEIVGIGNLDVSDNPLPEDLIHSLPVEFPKRYCYSSRLAGWLAENLGRFDGVILHGMWLYPNWAAAQACRAAGVPYVCFPHGMLDPWSVYGQGLRKGIKKRLYWFLREREVFEHAAALFFTMERERLRSCQTFRLPMQSHIVAPYGIQVAEPSLDSRNDYADPSLNGDFALFLGRVHPKKNVGFLIEAWAEASPPANWRLIIAGPGERAYLKHLHSVVKRLGLDGRVVFRGLVTGRAKALLFRRAKWFLLPSQQENFGIAVLEALSLRCPVAISDQVYLADHFPSGSEVMPLEFGAWVKFLRERMVDEAWRSRVLAQYVAEVLPRYRFDRVAREWVETVERVFLRAQG